MKVEEALKKARKAREEFPEGTRVRLVRMNDTQAPAPGTLGTVVHVDDIGMIHVNWDSGSTLGAMYGEDIIEPIGQ